MSVLPLVNDKTVLFVASYANCPRVWKMASALSKNNKKVTIIEWDRSSKLPSSEMSNKISVYRMKLKAPYGARLLFLVPVWWAYVSLLLLVKRFDVIQPQNLDNLMVSMFISRSKGMKIVYDMADFYADAYIPQNLRALRHFVTWIENTLIAFNDATIVVDDVRLKQVNVHKKNFSIIYNTPPDLFQEVYHNYKEKSNIDSSLTLFYAGILDKDRGLDTIFNAIQGITDVNLVVAGFGRLECEIPKMLRNKFNIKFLGRISYEEVLDLTLQSDCVIGFYDPSVTNNLFASPNKLFEAMMCKKPIIVNDGTSLSSFVKREKCGFVVKFGDVKELHDLIESIKNNKSLLDQYGRNGRVAYENKYNWKLMESRLLSVYENLF